MPGIKHLIECHCVLPLYRDSQKIIYHKFPVYSKIKEDGRLIEKLVKCNNCEAVHLIKELCKSLIQPGKDQTNVTLSKEDMSYMLSDKLVSILEKTNSDISIWEHVLDIVDEKRWGEDVVIKREIIDEKEHLKILRLLSENKFKVFSESINNLIIKN
jgi:hypothetical protein